MRQGRIRQIGWFTGVMMGVAVVVGLTLVGTAVGESHEESGSSPARIPTPVVGTHELVELFAEPLFEELKDAVHEANDGEENWDAIEHLGLKAAEIANLVAIVEQRPEGATDLGLILGRPLFPS